MFKFKKALFLIPVFALALVFSGCTTFTGFEGGVPATDFFQPMPTEQVKPLYDSALTYFYLNEEDFSEDEWETIIQIRMIVEEDMKDGLVDVDNVVILTVSSLVAEYVQENVVLSEKDQLYAVLALNSLRLFASQTEYSESLLVLAERAEAILFPDGPIIPPLEPVVR